MHKRNNEKFSPLINIQSTPDLVMNTGRRLDRLFYKEAMHSEVHPYGLASVEQSARMAKNLAHKNSESFNPVNGRPKLNLKPALASSTHHLETLGLHSDWKITNNYKRY